MGCGSSSPTAAQPVPPVPQVNVDRQQIRTPNLPSKAIQRVPSSSSECSDTRRVTTSSSPKAPERIASATSQKSTTSRMSAAAKSSTSIKKVKNPSIHSESNVNLNLVIIWVDTNLNHSNKIYSDALTKLQRITTSVYTVTNAEQCMKQLDSIHDKRVYLIVSDELGEEVVPQVHDSPQIHSIYIFTPVKRQRLRWANEWSEKIKKISSDMEEIFQEIKFSSGQVGSLTPISIIRRMDLPNSIDNELDQSFMYTQLLKDILLEMKHDPTLKSKLVEYCQTKYADDILQLGLIDEFGQQYDQSLAIHWYTKESFLYSMINRALRTQDIETIMKMGFFLHDLHEQIVELYNKQAGTRDSDKFFVYRGQGMAPEELEAIEANRGGLISFNNFLSTTLDEKMANTFIEKACLYSNVAVVLFQMEIDPKIQLVPFAVVSQKSAYKDEKEVLFSMHSIFRIINTRKLQDRVWQIDLALTNYNDPQLKQLTDYMKKELGEGTPLGKLGSLMLKMGEYNQAEEIFAPELKTTDETNWQKQAHLNHQLGYVYSEKGDYKTALACYEKALKLELEFCASNTTSIATTYNNLAGVHGSLGDYKSALSSYHKALEIEEKTLAPDHPTLATTYSNIGVVQKSLGDYTAALTLYEKALEIRRKSLPPNHPDFATIYSNMGGLHQAMGDYPKTKEFYQKSLDIRTKYLPPKHPDLASSYSNFGSLYDSMGEYQTALEYYERALQHQKLSLSDNHPDKASVYNCIGSIYHSMEDYPTALSWFKKALEIQKQAFPDNHRNFAYTYSHFGSVYSSMEDNPTALSYYEKALEIERISLPPNHPSIVTTYNNIGTIHQSMHDYPTALSFYEKAREICQANSQLAESNAAAVTFNRLGSVRHAMKEYSIAIQFFEKALDIRSKAANPKERSLAITYSNMGSSYHELNDYQNALSNYHKALEIEEKTLPSDHKDLATSYNNIGLVYAGMKDYNKALSFYEKAVAIREKKTSANNSTLASTYSNMASAYYDMEDYTQSYFLLQ